MSANRNIDEKESVIMADIVYCYNDEVYFNLTNKCPCNCTFCIRNNGDSVGEAKTLWFDKEPTMEEIYKTIDAFDFSGYKEAVFCGYGEPTMALDKIGRASCRERV